MLREEKIALSKRFKVEDLGKVYHILGMSVKKDRKSGTLTISQPKYLEGVLKKFNMENCKLVSTPLEPGSKYQELSSDEEPINVPEYQRLIGCLTYAATSTRPDIASGTINY